MLILCARLFVSVACSVIHSCHFAQGSFNGLGDLPGGSTVSYTNGVSWDGSVAVGTSHSSNGDEAFRWTESTGMQGIGDLSGGGFSSSAYDCSSDGSVLVGISNSSNGWEAFRWTQEGGMKGLGFLPGGFFYSIAYGVSADGSVVVGFSFSDIGDQAFRWTQSTGMQGLGELPGGFYYSFAYGVSGNGSAVVGYSSSGNGEEAFRWTQATGMQGIGDLPGGIFGSVAYDVSEDGTIIVGYGLTTNNVPEGFRWTLTSGMQGLGTSNTIALACSHEGSVIVGSWGGKAMIWDAIYGVRTVTDWLKANGIDVPQGWFLEVSNDVGMQSSIVSVVGNGTNPSGQSEGWLAKAPFGGGVIYVSPSSFAVLRGDLLTGELEDLFFSDDNSIVVRRPRSQTIGGVEIKVDFIGISSLLSVEELAFTFEGSSSQSGATQQLFLKNYQTGLFEEVDTRTATTQDSTVYMEIKDGASRFVESQKGTIHARVVWTKKGSVPAEWTTSIDTVRWDIWGK
ncbi:MAG TPA: hypothetical protein VNK96_02955 [Fimbriimonadales bacterium]|nr:hypothetical protein [Fimbriimonadales bacterium]